MTTTIAKFAHVALFASILAAGSAQGAISVLTFEGLKDLEAVNEFYNGGTGSSGSLGPNYGVAFNSSSLAVIDFEAGGTGNFANEPSPNTVLFFLEGDAATMNVAAGFTDGFSFYYSSAFDAEIRVYDGLNGAGNVIATIPLLANYDVGCNGDPTGDFCHWDPVGVAFAGTAKSIDFGGTQNFTGYDNVTFGKATPAPEPETLALLGIGLAVLGARRRIWS